MCTTSNANLHVAFLSVGFPLALLPLPLALLVFALLLLAGRALAVLAEALLVAPALSLLVLLLLLLVSDGRGDMRVMIQNAPPPTPAPRNCRPTRAPGRRSAAAKGAVWEGPTFSETGTGRPSSSGTSWGTGWHCDFSCVS